VNDPLVETLAAGGAGVGLHTAVQQRVPLQARGVGEGGAALLADVWAQG